MRRCTEKNKRVPESIVKAGKCDSMTREGKSFMIGSIGFVLFAMLRSWIPLHNMEFFVVACAVFMGVTLLAYLFTGQKDRAENPLMEKIWSVAGIALLGFWIILFYINETHIEQGLPETKLVRRYFPFPLWIALMVLGTLVCLFILQRKDDLHRRSGVKGQKLKKRIRFVVSLLFTAGVSVQFYAPNIFQDVQGGTYHSHAYTNSIINVCWLIPYSKNMESLYGHYGILYMPVLKFLHKCFHVDYLTGIFVISALIAGASILLFLYVLNYFTQHDLIFYLGMFAIGEEYFQLMQGGVFLQVHPHRMIFPILLAALALREHQKNKNYSVAAVGILTLSFIWSTEVGIVTMLSFALYRWAGAVMDGKSFCFRKVLLLVREILVYALVPAALAYILINGYNLFVGGELLSFREFMFPLVSDRDYIDKIELALPDVTHAWIGSAVLFMGAAVPAAFQIFFPSREEKSSLKPFYFFLGVMSLVLMLYYINRPVEGCMFITLFLMLVLQAVIFRKSQKVYLEWREEKDSVFAKPDRFFFLSLRVITVFLLFVMAFDGVYSMPGAWKASRETIWKRAELAEFGEYLWVQIPPDAVSFGEGVPELMAMIDRDTHLHSTEWSYLNMPLDTMEWVRYELEDEPWFFCSLKSLSYLQENYPGLTDHFYIHEEFDYNGEKFGFFRANPEN